MGQLFDFFFLKPLYNLLVILSLIFKNNVGWAMFFLAILIRMLIWPWYNKMLVSQKKMQEIQPQLKELQKQYKNDPKVLNQKIMELFKNEKINPLESFLYAFVQILLFFAVFYVAKGIIQNTWQENLYSFIPKIPLNYNLINGLNVIQPSLILAIFYFILTFITLIFFQKEASQNKLFFVFPFLFLLLYKSFPALLLIFWIGLSLVGLAQEIYLKNKKYK